MPDYSIRTELLSAQERDTLSRLNVELLPHGSTFHRQLNKPDMHAVGQILFDLKYRTNDEENHINFAIGDWINQVDKWFSDEAGIHMALGITPTLFNSCFISFSHNDKDFVKHLYSKLRTVSITVWYAPEDIKGGKKLYDQIEHAIQQYDRLLIVLSKNSLRSEWVMSEIRRAHKVEIKENRGKLFPIRLCSMEAIREWECFDADTGKDLAVEVREYFIPDFVNWKDSESFQTSFSKLLDDLKK